MTRTIQTSEGRPGAFFSVPSLPDHRTAFPLELKMPVDLYLRLDPFIAIITLLGKKAFILSMLPAFGVLLLVFVFGNFFCGWFCPMGATIDFFDRVLFREKKRPKGFNEQPLRRLRYGILFFSLAAGLMAWQLLYLLDPISLITRTLVISFYPPAIYVFNHLIPKIQRFLRGIPISSLRFLCLSLRSISSSLSIFLGILALGLVRKRFWCRYLCPLGTLFSMTTRLPHIPTVGNGRVYSLFESVSKTARLERFPSKNLKRFANKTASLVLNASIVLRRQSPSGSRFRAGRASRRSPFLGGTFSAPSALVSFQLLSLKPILCRRKAR